jgi:hypothetical protein
MLCVVHSCTHFLYGTSHMSLRILSRSYTVPDFVSFLVGPHKTVIIGVLFCVCICLAWKMIICRFGCVFVVRCVYIAVHTVYLKSGKRRILESMFRERIGRENYSR